MNPDRLSLIVLSIITFLVPFVSWSLRKKKFNKDVFFSVIILTASVIWSTMIRSSILTLVVITIFFLVKIYRTEFKLYILVKQIAPRLVILSSCFLFLSICFILYFLKPNSALGRILIWKVSITELLIPNWFSGIGFENFSWAYNKAQSTYFQSSVGSYFEGVLAGNVEHAHNEYLQFAIEFGFPLFLLGLGVLIWVFWDFRKYELSLSERLKNAPRSVIFKELALLGAKSTVVAIATSSLFTFPLHYWQVLFWFICMYLIIGVLQGKFLLFLKMFNWLWNPFYLSVKRIHTFATYSLRVFLLSIFVFALFNAWQIGISKYELSKDWNWVKQVISMRGASQTIPVLERLYPNLEHQGEFLFNYAAAYLQQNDYESALPLLERAIQNYSNPNLYLSLAKAYRETGQLSKAEQTYYFVHHMIPHRFYPLHEWAYTKLANADTLGAIALAYKAVLMPEKVPSRATKEIKDNMQKLLDRYHKPSSTIPPDPTFTKTVPEL